MSSIEGPRVLVGDFNITPWSGHFSTFLESAGLRDCIQGRWPLTTWPATGWPMGLVLSIRIDQCLHSPDIMVADVRTGPTVGSDHCPMINELRLPASGLGADNQEAAASRCTRSTPPQPGA